MNLQSFLIFVIFLNSTFIPFALANVDPLVLEAMEGEKVLLERDDGSSYRGLLKKVAADKVVMVLDNGRVVAVQSKNIVKVHTDMKVTSDSTSTVSRSQTHSVSSSSNPLLVNKSAESSQPTPTELVAKGLSKDGRSNLRSTLAGFIAYEFDSGLDIMVGAGISGCKPMGSPLANDLPIYPCLALDVRYTYGYQETDVSETELNIFGVFAGGGLSYLTPKWSMNAALLVGMTSFSTTTWVYLMGEQEVSGSGENFDGLFSIDFRFYSLYLGLDFGIRGGGASSSIGIAF